MSRPRGGHWRIPVLAISTFIGGCSLALGHHLFYSSLHKEPVPNGNIEFAGRTLSKQQFNILVGTSFAFLVKVFLCFAVSVAYVQAFWKDLKSNKSAPSLRDLDWASSGLENIFWLFHFRQARRHLTLVILALVFWCVVF